MLLNIRRGTKTYISNPIYIYIYIFGVILWGYNNFLQFILGYVFKLFPRKS